MLILDELLTLADNQFVKDARETFFATNISNTGEITFEELTAALKGVRTEGDQELTENDYKDIYSSVDADQSGTVTWSEWQASLSYQTQLTQKNLRNVFNFLDLKQQGVIKVQTLEKAYKPHMFRLVLEQGTEAATLRQILADAGLFTGSLEDH